MTSHTDARLNSIKSKPTTEAYRDGFEAIFGKAGYPKPTNVSCPQCTCTPKEKENDREIQESK